MAPLLARRPAADRTFERLYRRHSADVYRYALALLRDPDDAEDATQTAFMNAYRALVRGEQPKAPKAWLLAIVHNVCRMRRRALARRPREVPLDEQPLAAVEEERPQLDVVLAALAELPLNQRAALVMREVEGRSYNEIAGVLGVSTSAVEALIFRARRTLRVKREALGAIAVAPVPASLAAVQGTGIVATAVGSDLVLKAAAGIAAALLAGGAAYKATTGTARGATDPPRRHAPGTTHVVAATATLRRGTVGRPAAATRRMKATRPRAHARGGTMSAPQARSRPHATTGSSATRKVVAPVRTPRVYAPAQPQQGAQPQSGEPSSSPTTIPSVQTPAVTVQVPTVPSVPTPQLPPVTVPSMTTPTVTLPPPPPLPKLPPLPKIP